MQGIIEISPGRSLLGCSARQSAGGYDHQTVSFHEVEMSMHPTLSLENQLLVTKFYMPVPFGHLVARPRLNALLGKSLKYPLTLVSAPAGFGKTTLLSIWVRSLQTSQLLVVWLSLDEEDNDPQLFWMYVLAALERQRPGHFGPLLGSLQSSQVPSLKSVLTALINLLLENGQHVVLILDDYHVITNPEIHTTISYLVHHIPPQSHLILATRSDPPLPLTQWRARQQMLEVRTQQLRCTTEETGKFFQEAMGVQLPERMIKEVVAHTEGWLVSLQLLGLALPKQVDPQSLLEEIRGDQRYILDYLTEEVLYQQLQEVQMFLLSTCILEQLSASLCDAVTEQKNSRQMLQLLERANLFLTSLDSKREWYRYHALFAEALRSQLERTYGDLVPILHNRASHWYAQHSQMTQAILHAFKAHQWHWAADLIEQVHLPLSSLAWGTGRHAPVLLKQWLAQLPSDIMACRPRLCLTCVHLLWMITPDPLLQAWLDAAKTTLMASLKSQMPVADTSHPSPIPQARQEQMDLLGEILGFQAFLLSHTADGQAAFILVEQAQAFLSAENAVMHVIVALAKSIASYSSSANDAVAAIENGYQSVLLAQVAGLPALAINMMAMTALHLIGAGRLHEADQVTKQAILLDTQSGGSRLPEVGWVTPFRAEILREWNDLASAHSLATEAISLCEQAISLPSLSFLYGGYVVLGRVCLSCGDLDAACTFLQQAEQIGKGMNQQIYLQIHSHFTTIEQVRLWLASGEMDQATRWIEELNVTEQHLTPFARERQEVARAHILLAKDQPIAALQCLDPVCQRATAGQRWGHVIEIRLLQALAHQRLHEEPQALVALSEAVRLGEPEGYLRSFVEEGEAMVVLLCKLREKQRKVGPTPYLDRVLAAFPKSSQMSTSPSKRMAKQTQSQPLREPLSERELQVIKLMAKGTSNQEIAQELVIVVDTVKRHVGHIFAKLGVKNRVQAVRQAQKLGLLDEAR
jgi:LuxR family maltose regulon positive regulatory protein